VLVVGVSIGLANDVNKIVPQHPDGLRGSPVIILKERRLAAANSKWKVYLEALADHKGNAVSDYMVVEGQHSGRDLVTGVAVLPIVNAGFVLLRCYRRAVGSVLWEVPRGFIDEGESPETAALRELKEETGLCCAPEHLVPLGLYAPEPSTFAARGALFAATQCEGTLDPAKDEIGIEEIAVIDDDGMSRLASNGEIEDAGTLIAYYRYRALSLQHGAR
jgi:ADP-ribose pyrophosphatase